MSHESPLDQYLRPATDQYCMTCYEVVPLDEITTHRATIHDGSPDVDIVGIHKTPDTYIAKDTDMGHTSPHRWLSIDNHDMCTECGAVKIKPDDLPTTVTTRTNE